MQCLVASFFMFIRSVSVGFSSKKRNPPNRISIHFGSLTQFDSVGLTSTGMLTHTDLKKIYRAFQLPCNEVSILWQCNCCFCAMQKPRTASKPVKSGVDCGALSNVGRYLEFVSMMSKHRI